MLWSTAFAQGAGAAKPSMIESLFPMVLIFLVFYFLIIRPQSKQRKEHKKLLGELKRGDEVVTSSGILGRIEGLTDKFVTLEIADGVRIKMLRSQIAGYTSKEKE